MKKSKTRKEEFVILIISLSLLIGYFNGSKTDRLEKEDLRHDGCLIGVYRYMRDIDAERYSAEESSVWIFTHCAETIMEYNEEISRDMNKK